VAYLFLVSCNDTTAVNARQATKFVESHGVVSQSARGPVPNLADAIAGTAIKGSWWGHAKGRQIFRAAKAICENPDVLVCKLIEGKITYVHRRLWPALVKLAPRFPTERLAKVWNEHTRTGAHQSKQRRFPSWVPPEVQKQAKALTVADAEKLLSKCLPFSAALEKRSTRNRLTKRWSRRS
jgi:hypothetical protein